MQNKAVITILDSINFTTMPYNEFILYRNSHYNDEKQILLMTGFEINISIKAIPSNLEIHTVGKNPFHICHELKKIILECKRKNLDYLIHLHSIRGSFSVLCAMIMGKISRERTVYTIHSTFSGFRLHNKILSCFNSLLSNYVTCVSETAYIFFPKIVRKIKSNKMLFIQNGVDCERIDNELFNRLTNRVDDCDVYFVYIARMIPIKNHKFLIDVLKKCSKNVKFIFIGADENKTIYNYAKECDELDRIKFTGLIPRKEVYKILNDSSDVYISSSKLEGLPISVLEAMFCGLPVILSDIPQHREIKERCSNVEILPLERNVWINKINQLALTKKEELKKIGLLNKEKIKQNFSLKQMHEKYDEIYKKIFEMK